MTLNLHWVDLKLTSQFVTCFVSFEGFKDNFHFELRGVSLALCSHVLCSFLRVYYAQKLNLAHGLVFGGHYIVRYELRRINDT